MIGAPGFHSWQEMQTSSWLDNVKQQMQEDKWPRECKRCQDTEKLSIPQSIRLNALSRDQILKSIDPDYQILGGVLDNICNSACQSCNAGLSTKIGSLHTKDFVQINNTHLLDGLPWNHILEVDLNGGEPSASPNYRRFLQNLPLDVKILRINTNGSRVMPELSGLLDKNLKIIITLSFDGTGSVHDYVRWPIQWTTYLDTVYRYQQLAEKFRNLSLEAWTVVHALNVADMPNILKFCLDRGIKHSWAWLDQPSVLSAKHSNQMTLTAKQILFDSEIDVLNDIAGQLAILPDNQAALDAFIKEQDSLRKITIKEFL